MTDNPLSYMDRIKIELAYCRHVEKSVTATADAIAPIIDEIVTSERHRCASIDAEGHPTWGPLIAERIMGDGLTQPELPKAGVTQPPLQPTERAAP